MTADADSPAEKAAAIQAYLRSSEFSYSTERLPGSGYQALENFLLRDHKGYCEQFASAMAMMARVVGIPSRVSVGFLPGDRDGDSWRVSIRDMHAWPELYFAGYGWVRFEPTPASITGAAPSWTVRTEQRPGRESVRRTVRRAHREHRVAERRPVGGSDHHTDDGRSRTGSPDRQNRPGRCQRPARCC